MFRLLALPWLGRQKPDGQTQDLIDSVWFRLPGAFGSRRNAGADSADVTLLLSVGWLQINASPAKPT